MKARPALDAAFYCLRQEIERVIERESGTLTDEVKEARGFQGAYAQALDENRALAAEVEKLREVARLSKIVERYGCEVGSQTWSELRDALAAVREVR